MTVQAVKSRPTPRRPKPARRPFTLDQLDRFYELAEQLQGRPLPGVHVSEEQYLSRYFGEDLNSEWVDGEVIIMAPVSGEHSDLNFWLQRLVVELVEFHDLGLVRGPEFQIRLAEARRRRNPDVAFVAKSNLSKLRPNHLEGSPDLIIEIVSPDSVARDWRDKYREYELSGVREYWVVDPLSKKVDVYTLGRSRKYSILTPDADERIHSKVLRGLYIRPAWLWQTPLPKLSVIAKELGLR